MKLKYIKATEKDAELLIDIYNSSFYNDYIKYGECPAYNKTLKQMQESIDLYPKQIILCDNIPVGVISVQNKGEGKYYIGCLCVIPKYQRKGIGTQAFQHIFDMYSDWKQITLVTPLDKKENIKFYTRKCGCSISDISMDGNVKVVHLYIKR